MSIEEQEIEAVAEYLRRSRVQRDLPARRMAREALEVAAQVRSGTRVAPSPKEIERRAADRAMQRKQHHRQQ